MSKQIRSIAEAIGIIEKEVEKAMSEASLEKKSDGVDGWRKDPSYINAILREGFKKETAVICMQILADK